MPILNMLRLLISFLIINFFFQMVEAQKIDLDKRSIKIEYTNLPSNGDLAALNSYSVEFNANPSTVSQLGLTNTFIENQFVLEGFTYLSTNADFIYSIKIESPQIIREAIEEVKSEITNKDNSKTTVINYRGSVVMTATTTLTVKKNPNGAIIFNKSFATASQPVSFQTQNFDTKDKALSVVNTKHGNINTYIRAAYIKLLENEVDILKETYTFKKAQFSEVFWEIDLKKAPELVEFNNQLTKAATYLEKLSYKQSNDEIKKEMKPILDYWSESAAKIQGEDKKQRKLKYGYLINLAKAQYRLELLDDCEKTAQLIIDNDYDKTDGRMMQSYASDLREKLKKINVNSQYIARPGFNSEAKFTLGVSSTTINKTKPTSLKEDIIDIKNTVKNDFGTRVLKDSIDWIDSYFSTIKFTFNGELIELKEGKLDRSVFIQWDYMNNNRTIFERNKFTIEVPKKQGIIKKEGEFVYLGINIYNHTKNIKNFDADALITLLKEYENTPLTDIYTKTNDSLPFRSGDNFFSPKMVYLKDYDKKLSVDASISFYKKSFVGNTRYTTDNGDKFEIQIIEKRPVILKNVEFGMNRLAYMVRLKIPEIRFSLLTSAMYKEYKYITIKDVEIYTCIISQTL